LVSSLPSYLDYQMHRAWTWEHQALVRARAVAGDPALAADFERIRGETLSRPREPAALAADVASMRRRMRAELDRSDAGRFDLKQGAGGLVDLEFLVQYLVLREAGAQAALQAPRDTPGLLPRWRRPEYSARPRLRTCWRRMRCSSTPAWRAPSTAARAWCRRTPPWKRRARGSPPPWRRWGCPSIPE